MELVSIRKERVSSSVLVRLLPRHAKVRMSVAAAKHLFRLLQTYNRVAEAGEAYTTRWALFWPFLKRIERKALVLLLMMNGVESIGTPLHAIEVPVELEDDREVPFWSGVLSAGVEAELRSLVGRHHARIIERSDVVAWWADCCEEDLEWLGAMGVLDEVLDPSLGFHSDLMEQALVGAMTRKGMAPATAEAKASRLAAEVDELLLQREDAYWNGLDVS